MSATSKEYADRGRLSSAREWLWNQKTLPGYFLSDREYGISLKNIQQFRPRVLWGPTPALTGLANYVQRTGADVSVTQDRASATSKLVLSSIAWVFLKYSK